MISSCKEGCGCSCGSGYGCGYGYGHGMSWLWLWLWLLLLAAGEQMPHSDTGVIIYKQTNDIGSSSFNKDLTVHDLNKTNTEVGVRC